MKNLITLFSYLFFLTTFSQNTVESTEYNNDFEKDIFIKIESGDSYNLEDLYSAIDYEKHEKGIAKKTIIKIIKDLDAKKVGSKNTKKKIKEIVKYISSNFLKKQKLNSSFNDLLVYKVYNPTSATSLYSLILDHYQIPYTINEIDGNEFITAFTNSKEIIIQSNNQNFHKTHTISFKNSFINYLKENTSSKEINDNDEAIFNKYYKDKSVITKTNLVAQQYYNVATEYTNNQQYKKAVNYAEKAYTLFPSEKITFYYNMLLAQVLNDDLSKNEYNALYLGKFLNLNSENQNGINNINNIVVNAGTNYLIKNQKIEDFENFFSSFKKSTNLNNIDFSPFQEIYHIQLSDFHYYKREYDKTILHLAEALIINPKNLSSQNNLENTINAVMSITTDDNEIIKKYNHYFDTFPFVQENNLHQLNYTRVFLKKIYDSYITNDTKQGKEHIQNFKNLLLKYPNIKYDKNIVENVFITAASKYNMNSIKNSISIINTGLKFAPESKILSEALKKLKSFKSNSFKTTYNDDYEDIEKTFTESFIAYFKNCWTVTTIKKVGKDINKEEHTLEFSLEIDPKKYKTAYFIVDGKKTECEWSIRYNSQLLYLIPKNNRSNYYIYKINDINEKEITLRPFVKNKMTNRILTLTKCN